MKNLPKVSFITACSFLLIFFCGYSPADTGSSPPAVKAGEETPFPMVAGGQVYFLCILFLSLVTLNLLDTQFSFLYIQFKNIFYQLNQ